MAYTSSNKLNSILKKYGALSDEEKKKEEQTQEVVSRFKNTNNESRLETIINKHMNAEPAQAKRSTPSNELRNSTYVGLKHGPNQVLINNTVKKQQEAEKKTAAEDKIFSGYSLDRQKSTIENLQKQLEYAKNYNKTKRTEYATADSTVVGMGGMGNEPAQASEDYIQELEAKITRFANLYYTNKNESQLSQMEKLPEQKSQYEAASKTDEDNDVIRRVLDKVNTGNFEWDEDYEYVAEKFGITTDNKSMEQYRDELMAILDEGKQFVSDTATQLDKLNFDYEGLENYKAMLKAQEEYDAQVERARQNYEKRPFISNLGTVANAPGMAVEAIAKGIKSIGHNDPTDLENYRPMNKYNMPVTTYVQAVRQATDEDIDSEVLSFLYSTGMSVADSTVLALTFGPAATVAMGGASAANYMQEAVDRGLSNKQILTGAIATGAAEAVFEYFSIDKLLNGAMNAATVKELLKSIGIQAVTEGSEEIFTEIANIISDEIIAGRNSKNAKLIEQYMAQGMTEEEAKKQVILDNIKNIALAGLGGAISGGVSAGGFGAVNVIGEKLSQSRAVTDYAKAIQADTEMMQAYVESGLESEEGTEARKRAEKIQQKLEGDKKVSTKDVKNLIKADEAQVTSEEYGFTPAALKKAEDSYNTYRQTTKSPVSKDVYFGEYQIAYEYGKLGVKQEVLNKSGVLKNLSENARIVAYNQGLKETTLALGQKQMKMSRKEIDNIIKGGKVKLTNVSEETIAKMNVDQMSVIRLADVLTKIAPNMTVEIFESVANKKGEFEVENGSYRRDTRTLSLDLNAGRMTTADYRTTLVRTLSHELTHFIEAEAKDEYKALSEFVIKKLTEGGKYTVEQLVEDKMKADKTLSKEGALAEVVAEGCEMVFENSEAFAELAQTNRTLWEKIKDWFDKTIKQLKSLYKGVEANSYEGRVMKEYIDELTEIWDKGFKKAVENTNATEAVGVQIDTETESAAPVQMSMRTWNKSEYVEARDLAATSLSMALGVTKEQAFKYIDDVNSVAKMIADDKVRLDYTPELEFSTALKTDSEYIYTVDMSTLCAKRLLFTGTMNAIQKMLPNTVLDSEATVRLRQMMLAKGYEAACGICYVESTRREIAAVTQDFIERYKISQKTGKPMTKINAEGQEKLIKSNKETGNKTFIADKNFTPTLADLNTTDGLNDIRKNRPELALAYDTYMNMRGQQKPKLLETRTEYKGEILTAFKSRKTVNKFNKMGGLRLQSYSDFESPHLIDMMQVIMDMSRVGLMSHAYTKVPNFAWAFGDTGVKINLSLIAKGDGIDADGNLIFDDVEGMPFKEAMKLRDRYSENVGTILVGKSFKHIVAAMADDRIDFIIPFHKSQWNASLYEALGLGGYEDFTKDQNERILATGEKVERNFKPSEYWDYSKSGDENAQIYLKKCRDEGRAPKFPQFAGYPGYWKLLIDYKMYNNDGVGAPQKIVKPDFNMVEAERIMKEYEGGADTLPVAKDIVDEFVKEFKDKEPTTKKQNQLRRNPYTDRRILEDAVTSIDRSAFTSQELTVLDRFRGRLNEIGNTEHLIKKYKDMGDNITPADKNRLKNAEARLIKQNDELFESLGRTGVKVVTNKASELLIQKYGSIEPGEKPFREVSVPARTNKGNKVSQTVRTAMEAEATSDEMVERLTEEVVKGGFSYIPITDAESKKYADDTIKRKGWNDALLDWTAEVNKNQLGKNNVALGFQLYNNALNAGDTETAVRILTDLAARVREGAQMVQAVRMLKKLSPEYQLYGIQRSIQTLQDSLNERYGDNAPQLEMDSQLVKNYEQAETEEARTAAQEAIYRHVAAQIPHTFMDKWNSWRYLAMLFNPRTHVRNILGNAMFAPVRGAKNATAALIEKLVPQEQRTKAIASGSKLYKAALDDYKIVADQITGAGKYNDAIGEIERMKPAFGSSKIAKPLNWLANANSYALEAEDMWFSRPAYASALAGYLKARGITDMSTMQQSELDKARAYAIKEAQKATYRDFNDFSNFISAIGRKSKAKNKVVAVAQTVAEGVLPFRRTPANILVRGVEYSPVGLAKGIVQATRGVKKGTATAAEAIDSIASGLVGSALLGLGTFLVKQGVLSAGEDKDKKQQEFDELMGGQNYALNIGGINFTIDWLAPEALPLFVGAEIANVLIENDGEFNLAAVLEGVSRISEPMLEMSMLSSLQDVIENVSYSDGKLMGILVNAFTSYLSQGLPTLAGQIERVTETERETTWVDRNKTQIERDLQYLLGKSANKTPGEYQQIPYIDAWGRRESTGTVLARIFNNMLNPAYVSEDVSTPTDNELQRLYDLGFDEVFPNGVSQSDKIDGEYLSADEYVKYAETRGQRQRQLIEDVISADWYDKLDDTEKSEVIKKAYDYAAETAKRDVKDTHEVPKWAQEVEKTSDKAESIKNYALNLASEEMSSSAISKYYEEIESTGIEFDVYKDYYVRMKEAKGTDADGDGKTDSGSKKKAVMDIINSLNISRDQKDALYLLSYKESTIDEAPWH